MKNMYAAKCIYKTSLYNLDETKIDYIDQFEERIFLIKAKSLDDADKKSKKYALEYEDTYINPYGEIVKTRLYEILDIYELFEDNRKNNIEVYSNIFYTTDKQLNKSLSVSYPYKRKKVNNKRFEFLKFNGFDESVDEETKKQIMDIVNND